MHDRNTKGTRMCSFACRIYLSACEYPVCLPIVCTVCSFCLSYISVLASCLRLIQEENIGWLFKKKFLSPSLVCCAGALPELGKPQSSATYRVHCTLCCVTWSPLRRVFSRLSILPCGLYPIEFNRKVSSYVNKK
jgi:hypothetical protein